MGHTFKKRCGAVFTTAWAMGFVVTGGCAPHEPVTVAPERPEVAPTAPASAAETLKLDASQIKPMYTEMLAVDLPSVVRVATAQNVDILQARQAVVASQGQVESAVGAAFPVLVPTALFEHVEGTVRATEGDLVGVGFNTFQPSIAVQWVINPGRVIYDIIASKKRLLATQQQEQAVILETLRQSVVQYYDLILAQAHVAAAKQGVAEAQELLRINHLRTRTGTGVPADELRAQARLAQRQQDLISAMMEFYNSSVVLAVTLHLDSSVTLIPKIEELPPVHLVRGDIGIDELLGIAIAFRPDLQQVRTLVEAVSADKGSKWWGGFGPQFQLAYQYGSIIGHANNVVPTRGIPNNFIVNPLSSSGRFSSNPLVNGLVREGILRRSRGFGRRRDQSTGFHDQQRISAAVGWRLSVSAFGNLKTAGASLEQARLEADRRLDQVRAEVVTASQSSKANEQLIDLAQQQVTAAGEALRLTQANLQAGTMTTLDVLQAQDTAHQARLHYAKAVVRYNQSQVNLLAALGLLDHDALVEADDDKIAESEPQP